MAYDPRKAAQVIAALILKSGKHKINVLKAVKLVYLIDRESIGRYGFPVLDEPRCSMRLGPVNSSTYDYIKGEVPAEKSGWSEFLADKENHQVGLVNKKLALYDLDELSEADISCIDSVWAKFGDMNQWNIVEWTHNPKNIPEWQNPGDSSLPIEFESIVHALGLANAEAIIEEYRRIQSINAVFDEVRGV